MEKTRVTVLVAGQKFTILSDESEKYVIDLAAKIDARITAMTLKNMSREKAAVLTALDFADDMEKDKKEREALKEQMKDYIEELSQLRSEKASFEKKEEALRKEIKKANDEKEAMEEVVRSLQRSLESFRIDSSKMVKSVDESKREEREEIPLPEEPPKPEITSDGDLSFDLPEDEEKPVHTYQQSSSPKQKKKHDHSHVNPYKENFMKKQEEKGYTPQRQYSLFDDE